MALETRPLDLSKVFRDDQGKDMASALEDTRTENHLGFFPFKEEMGIRLSSFHTKQKQKQNKKNPPNNNS